MLSSQQVGEINLDKLIDLLLMQVNAGLENEMPRRVTTTWEHRSKINVSPSQAGDPRKSRVITSWKETNVEVTSLSVSASISQTWCMNWFMKSMWTSMWVSVLKIVNMNIQRLMIFTVWILEKNWFLPLFVSTLNLKYWIPFFCTRNFAILFAR